MLAVGIGGGGDVVGALACAEEARRRGLRARVGGVSWERLPVDPLPGPRRLDELDGLHSRLHPAAALAGPHTSGPGGFLFAESRMAGVLGEPVVLLDPNHGPQALGAGLDAAAAHCEAELVVLLDVGGDVLGHGDEPGLGSPLCDALLLAASQHMTTPSLLAVFGAGCDGELTYAEVLERTAEVAAQNGWLGTASLLPEDLPLLDDAVAAIPTEASACALLCARGRTGEQPIRRGRRHVPLSPLGALTFYFDPKIAIATAARPARLVMPARDIDEAETILAGQSIRTELAYERENAP